MGLAEAVNSVGNIVKKLVNVTELVGKVENIMSDTIYNASHISKINETVQMDESIVEKVSK
ncbi:unnamed protein product, partial [Brugia pahangi]|uniref:Methyl-accepting chemotaxis protein n=1 Tax=Brugia pahangi TaxID=6280 RepID=A0A0N4TFK9_BRUPA